jgi:hypothetical protein
MRQRSSTPDIPILSSTKPHTVSGLETTSLGDACHEAMRRHHDKSHDQSRKGVSTPRIIQSLNAHVHVERENDSGDLIYSAREIANWWWSDPSNKARKKVYHIWSFYRQDEEQENDPIPFFKMAGTLCLSKKSFRAWLKRNQGRVD